MLLPNQSEIPLSSQDARLAIIQFEGDAHIDFFFEQSITGDILSLEKKIKNIKKRSITKLETNTAEALSAAKTYFEDNDLKRSWPKKKNI